MWNAIANHRSYLDQGFVRKMTARTLPRAQIALVAGADDTFVSAGWQQVYSVAGGSAPKSPAKGRPPQASERFVLEGAGAIPQGALVSVRPLPSDPSLGSRLNGWSMAVQSAAKAARGTSPTRGVADHDSNPTARRMAAAQKEFVAMAASQGRAELNQTSSVGMWETATLGDGLGGGMVAGPMPTSPTRDFAPETAEAQG